MPQSIHLSYKTLDTILIQIRLVLLLGAVLVQARFQVTQVGSLSLVACASKHLQQVCLVLVVLEVLVQQAVIRDVVVLHHSYEVMVTSYSS